MITFLYILLGLLVVALIWLAYNLYKAPLYDETTKRWYMTRKEQNDYINKLNKKK